MALLKHFSMVAFQTYCTNTLQVLTTPINAKIQKHQSIYLFTRSRLRINHYEYKNINEAVFPMLSTNMDMVVVCCNFTQKDTLQG